MNKQQKLKRTHTYSLTRPNRSESAISLVPWHFFLSIYFESMAGIVLSLVMMTMVVLMVTVCLPLIFSMRIEIPSLLHFACYLIATDFSTFVIFIWMLCRCNFIIGIDSARQNYNSRFYIVHSSICQSAIQSHLIPCRDAFFLTSLKSITFLKI